MAVYLLKRVLLVIPTLLGIMLFSFIIIQFAPGGPVERMIAEIVSSDGSLKRVPLICRIDTLDELEYFKNGGILQYVLRHLAA